MSSHVHSTPSLKISRKSVQPFSRNRADKERKKERKKEKRKERKKERKKQRNKETNKEIERKQYPVGVIIKVYRYMMHKRYIIA